MRHAILFLLLATSPAVAQYRPLPSIRAENQLWLYRGAYSAPARSMGGVTPYDRADVSPWARQWNYYRAR